VTVHAGEADGLDSVRSAIFDGRALRLGHGVRLAQDVTLDVDGAPRLGRLAEWVRDRGIALEVSPTSNVHTGAIAPFGSRLDDHPLPTLRAAGFAVTINTDNRLMSQTTLSRELALVVETFGFGLDDLEALQLNAVRAAFVGSEARERLRARVADGFATARSVAVANPA
jgi:adenosine deaminase